MGGAGHWANRSDLGAKLAVGVINLQPSDPAPTKSMVPCVALRPS